KQTFNVKIGNREIKATLNHPFLVLKRERIKGPPKTINKKWDRKLIWKQLKDIKEGDLIIVPRKILIGKEYKLEPANDTYITLTEIGSEKLRAVKGYSINQSVYSPDNIRHVAIRDDGAVYSKLKEVFKQNGLELEHSDYTLSKKGKIPPTTTEDFCRLLGFMIGDGWVSKSSNMNVAFAAGENEERNERYCQLFKRVFGLELKLYDRGRWYYSYSRPIGKLLREWGLDKHCKEKRIDNRIFSLPITHRKEFIKGLVDADGSRFKGGITVELSNKYLIKDLRKLIQTVGWRGGEIHNRARIVQPPNSKSPIKSETWSISFSEIERKYGARNFHGDRWEDVINYNDFIVRQVKSIEPNGQEEVFDITVEGAHNFVANNILVHNSMATPHVAGLLACARQFYREKLDTILTVDMVKEAMRLNAEANGLVKDNQIGWGPITWDILTKFGESLKPPKKGVPEAIPPEEEQL
ncbi:S8 family serine peptidase, partial [Candidatus Pacearchaeota archaeon]|nr:S8 family serine peptidase [Candidatus Pacearchaeota archaeon]